MPRNKTTVETLPDLTQAEWEAQKPCPKCGARPGWNPVTGVEVITGHRNSCLEHPDNKKH